jgi:hypothetical protein
MVTNQMFLGGVFNTADPVLHLPVYSYLFPFFLVMIGIVWAIMHYLKWKPLAPMHGLYYALKNGSTVAFIFDSFLVGELVSERDAKCIFNYAEDVYEIDVPDHKILDYIPGFKRIQIWLRTYFYYYPTNYLDNISAAYAIIYKVGKVNKDVEIARLLEGGKWDRSASVVCAGVPVDIVVDMDKWTIRTSKQHKAIVRSARAWNLLNEKDQIHSYQKYQDYLLSGKIVCPQEIQISTVIPWQRIDAAFPIDLDENEWAGKKWQKSKDDEDADATIDKKFATYLIIAGVGFAFLALFARWSMAFMTHKP